MELEHCCPELIMTRATHWQVPSQISLGKVQSLHFSKKKKSQHPYTHVEAYIDENIGSIPDFLISTWQALEQYPPTGGLQPRTVLQSYILVP